MSPASSMVGIVDILISKTILIFYLNVGKHYGNQADFNCGCTILIKDHGYPETYPFLGSSSVYENRGILLLRNPIEALFTSAHYLWSDNKQKGTVSPDLFKGPKWDDYVSNATIEWAEHADRWIQNIRNGTVIFYEKLLLEDTEAELNRLFRAINFMPIDPERMRCTLSHKSRSDLKRTKKPTYKTYIRYRWGHFIFKFSFG